MDVLQLVAGERYVFAAIDQANQDRILPETCSA
jgi:hypothetical protein